MEDVARLMPAAPARRRWFLLGLLVLFVGLSIQYTIKVRNHGDGSSAFNRWRRQVLAMDQGLDPYPIYGYPNPPMMALLLLPYYKVPELPGALAWYYTKVGFAFWSLLWIFRIVEDPDRPFPDWAKALTALLSLKPIMGDLTHGNINLLILFLVVAALYAFRQRYDVSAGVTLALAIVCKVTPALFVPYFLWKRAWKTLAGCSIGLVLFYLVIPGIYFGPARNLTMLQSWSDLMIRPFVGHGKVEYPDYVNQSVPGLAQRLLTHSPSISTWINGQTHVPVRYDNIATLSPDQVRLVILGSMAFFAAMVMVVCRTPTSNRRGWRFAAEAGIVLLGMLLFSERTWKHHCVTLALPLAVLCYRLAWADRTRERGGLIAALVATLLLMGSTSIVGVPSLDEAARLAQVYGAYVWAFIILAGSLALLLWRGRDGAKAAAPKWSHAGQVAQAA